MEQIDLNAETKKLRQMSPLNNEVLKGILMVFLIATAMGVGGTVLTEPQNDEPWWIQLAIMALVQAGCLATAAYVYLRMSKLIKRGNVIFAKVESTHWLPKNIHSINLEYEIDDAIHTKAINGPGFFARDLKCQPALLAAVDPKDPKSLTLLYKFARSKKEREAIFFGSSGLHSDG
ncbi:hypothetical protein FHS27_006587 [Rhodopirellula rubra]|uniref:Uncharacterized protein n=1 Tax=Aporhodopirellula rubra TaxID=980271 RepID=A0A7W5E6P3_9BACT|nr:hypothetical protein [Aporhodopirellula rubra]MBB3210739.1 hypothetical protein [Aporhodopirellula rubra]